MLREGRLVSLAHLCAVESLMNGKAHTNLTSQGDLARCLGLEHYFAFGSLTEFNSGSTIERGDGWEMLLKRSGKMGGEMC